MLPYVDTRYNWSMLECRNFMINLCDVAQMSCEVAALPFQAHAIYGITWSIDFYNHNKVCPVLNQIFRSGKFRKNIF